MLKAKLLEEAGELAEATDRDDVVHEAADVLYFTLTAMARAGVELAEVEAELEQRSRKVTRRKGPENHAIHGFPVMIVEYTTNAEGTEYRHREITTVHGEKFYRFVLGVAANSFDAAREVFEKMTDNLAFLR